MWRERFRRGEYGPGGDAKVVENGEATLKVVDVESKWGVETAVRAAGTKRVAINAMGEGGKEFTTLKGVRVKGAQTIVGSNVLPRKGGASAVIKAREGLWEVKRGRKIDGGERRRAEVRAKRRSAERKA